jgi:hypothetical protein
MSVYTRDELNWAQAILTRARGLIESPERYVADVPACSRSGRRVRPTSKRAARWNAEGALEYIIGRATDDVPNAVYPGAVGAAWKALQSAGKVVSGNTANAAFQRYETALDIIGLWVKKRFSP